MYTLPLTLLSVHTYPYTYPFHMVSLANIYSIYLLLYHFLLTATPHVQYIS